MKAALKAALEWQPAYSIVDGAEEGAWESFLEALSDAGCYEIRGWDVWSPKKGEELAFEPGSPDFFLANVLFMRFKASSFDGLVEAMNTLWTYSVFPPATFEYRTGVEYPDGDDKYRIYTLDYKGVWKMDHDRIRARLAWKNPTDVHGAPEPPRTVAEWKERKDWAYGGS